MTKAAARAPDIPLAPTRRLDAPALPGADAVAVAALYAPQGVPLPAPGAAIDGMILGALPEALPASSALRDVPGVVPSDRPPQGRMVYVNGILTSPERQLVEMQLIADYLGHEVVGIHNASDGFFADAKEALDDRRNVGSHPSLVTVTQQVLAAVDAGEPLSLLGHSQGAAIISHALHDATAALRARGLTQEQVEEKLALISVKTAAGTAAGYPNGPHYDHHGNYPDSTTALLGIADGKAGRGAKVTMYNVVAADREVDLVPHMPTTSLLGQPIDDTTHGLLLHLRLMTGKPVPVRADPYAMTGG